MDEPRHQKSVPDLIRGRDNQLGLYLGDFILAYKFARSLKIFEGLTPCDCICNQ